RLAKALDITGTDGPNRRPAGSRTIPKHPPSIRARASSGLNPSLPFSAPFPLMLLARHHPVGDGQSSQDSSGDACVLVGINRVCTAGEERLRDLVMLSVSCKVFRPVGQSDGRNRWALFWSLIEPAAAIVPIEQPVLDQLRGRGRGHLNARFRAGDARVERVRGCYGLR